MRIAVIGAGPVGIEAALAGEARGHQVVVLEAAEVGAHVRRWGHVRLFTPWHMNTTEAGRSRLGDPLLASVEHPTGAELVARYLAPLAATLDVRAGHRVLGVSRSVRRKGDDLGSAARTDEPFRLLVATDSGEEIVEADAVLDCSGVLSDPAPVGAGGLPAPGERACVEAGVILYGPIPASALGDARRVLIVGNGASAATVLDELLDLGLELSWVTAEAEVPGFVSPADDPLPGRRRLAERAREALGRVAHHGGARVDRLALRDGEVAVRLTDGAELVVDRIVSCCGFRPDNGLLRELQYHVCWGSEGPMKLAAALLAASGGGGDCLAQPATGAEVLASPEPRLFVLGNKSYGRRSDFLLGVGHRQVADALDLLDR